MQNLADMTEITPHVSGDARRYCFLGGEQPISTMKTSCEKLAAHYVLLSRGLFCWGDDTGISRV